MWSETMNSDFEKEYAMITGITEFEKYTSPEEQAERIERCSILKHVNVTYSDRIMESASWCKS